MSDIPNAHAQTEDFEFSALQEAHNYRRALVTEFGEYLSGHVLEVGAGIGQLTEDLLRTVHPGRLVSLEPDAKFFGRLQASHPGLEAIQGTVAAVPAGGKWTAVLSINVLEHIEDDCGELAAYHRLLAPQRGHLCLFVPARPEIYAPLDKDFGHFRRYTRPELKQKLTGAGFEIVRLRYYNITGYFAWWFAYCVRKNRGFAVGEVRFYDRVIFPLVHAFESRICPPPFGQSLLTVARAG